jgi:hypothetical protein
LFFSVVSSGRELQKSFASPAVRPAAPFLSIFKSIKTESLLCTGGNVIRLKILLCIYEFSSRKIFFAVIMQGFCFFVFYYRETARQGERRAALAGAHGVDSKKATPERP